MFALSNDVYKELVYITEQEWNGENLYSLLVSNSCIDSMKLFLQDCENNESVLHKTFYMHLFDVLYTYNNSLHFIVKNNPCMDISYGFLADMIDDMVIDFKYNQQDYFMLVCPYNNEHIRYTDKNMIQSPYISISIYTNRNNMLIANSAVPIYQLYIYPLLNSCRVRIWDKDKLYVMMNNVYTDSSCGKSFMNYSEYMEYDEKLISGLRYPNKDTVVEILQYVLTQFYGKYEYIDKREGNIKKYKKPELQCLNVTPDGDIHTISLNHYKVLQANKVYQGGHHASPVTHVRRSYFRRSTNGDYIWDEETQMYKKVYGGIGTHVFVKSCIVNAGNGIPKNNYYVV